MTFYHIHKYNFFLKSTVLPFFDDNFLFTMYNTLEETTFVMHIVREIMDEQIGHLSLDSHFDEILKDFKEQSEAVTYNI